jgi:hypothetical protein
MPKLTEKECRDILSTLNNVSEISNKDIQKYVSIKMVELNLEMGTQPIPVLVNKSLGILKNEKKVIKLQYGRWRFPDVIGKEKTNIEVSIPIPTDFDIKIVFDFEKIIGPQNFTQTVYVYYYPAYKELAILKGLSKWRCKVGKTDSADGIYRIEDQTKTHIQEKPIAALMIRTNNCHKLEKVIHYILELNDQKCKDSMGSEWYETCPEEVEDIVKSILPSFYNF